MPQWAIPIIIMCVNLNQSANRMLMHATGTCLHRVNARVQPLSDCRAYPVAFASITPDSGARPGPRNHVTFSQAVIALNPLEPQFTPHVMTYVACDDKKGGGFEAYRLAQPLGPQWPDPRKRARRPRGSVHLVSKPLNGTAIQTVIPLGG